MTAKDPERIRDTVYVVGAGFSSGLGYPLTKSLLIDVWNKLEKEPRNQLRRIIEFHHPAFTARRKTSFPDIEQLLTEIAVNLDLFDASRAAEGTFKKDSLENARENLLSTIASWFHEIYQQATHTEWLSRLVAKMRRENAAIVSFNWDLVLDQLLFEGEVNRETYGLSDELSSGPAPKAARITELVRSDADQKGLRGKARGDIPSQKARGTYRGVRASTRDQVQGRAAVHTPDRATDLPQGFQASCVPAALESLHRRIEHAQKAGFSRVFFAGS